MKRPRRPDFEAAAAIAAKLNEIARTHQAKGAGNRQLAAGLRVADRPEDAIALYQNLRDGNFLQADAGFFSIAFHIEDIAYDRVANAEVSDPELKDICDRRRAIAEAEGLEGWPMGEGPEEYRLLLAEWNRIADRIVVGTFRDFGEEEMADLYRDEPEEFHRRREAGRFLLCGPLPTVSSLPGAGALLGKDDADE